MELLPIDIVDTVCLDYIHNVCLSVTKRLVELWVKGKKDIRMVDNNIQEVNNALLKLREYVPSEFCIVYPRPLSDIEFWKTTELRFFILIIIFYYCFQRQT